MHRPENETRIDLSALADFHRVAVAGSLGKASREHDRPKATLSRRIRHLEESLGVRLVERGGRALHLTAEGQLLYERTHGLLRDIEDAARDLSAAAQLPRGLLRVSAPRLFSDIFGGRLVAEFTARYPDVRVEWRGSDRLIDLIEEGFDVAIRVNPSPSGDLVGRCFAHDAMWVVAPPALALPAAAARQDPARVPAVGMAGFTDNGPWVIEVDGLERRLLPDYRLVLSSLVMVHAAVRAGAGVALLPRSLAREDVARGALRRWGTYATRTVDVWALHGSRRLVSPKVSAFVASLAERFPTRQL